MTRHPVLRHNEPMDQPVKSSLVSRIAEAPGSLSDGRGAEHFTELMEEARQATPDLAEVLHDPNVEDLLRGTFEGSPYLRSLATRDFARLARVLLEQPEAHFARLTETLNLSMRSAADMTAAKRALRIYKSRGGTADGSRRSRRRLAGHDRHEGAVGMRRCRRRDGRALSLSDCERKRCLAGRRSRAARAGVRVTSCSRWANTAHSNSTIRATSI